MNNAYRNFMKQQCLSEQARQAFYDGIQRSAGKRACGPLLKAAVIAACILLMVPITIFAAETIFNSSIIEIISGETSTGKLGTGVEASYPEVSSRALSEFSEEVRTMDEYTVVAYDSWQEAEEALGITLVKNALLFGETIKKESAYDLRSAGIGKRAQCHTIYNGMDHQLYRATLAAAYRYEQTHITLRATVTCQHPGIPEEKEYEMHWSGVTYEDADVAEISQQQYAAANGIQATIVTVTRTKNKGASYRAYFAANGASYIITAKTYDRNYMEETKAILEDILEAFVF